jgi:hypothetical protein
MNLSRQCALQKKCVTPPTSCRHGVFAGSTVIPQMGSTAEAAPTSAGKCAPAQQDPGFVSSGGCGFMGTSCW